MLPGYFDVFRRILIEEKLIEKLVTFIKEVNPDTVNGYLYN